MPRSPDVHIAPRYLVAACAALVAALFGPLAPAPAAAGPSDSCAPVASPTELLSNPRFERAASAVASSWDHNIWGGAAVNYGRDTSNPRSGADAQRIDVSTLGSGGYIFKQSVSLKGGSVYRGSIWMRSPNSATVDFQFRRAGPYYEPGAEARVTLTPVWKQYVIRGGFDTTVPAFFGLSFASPGTVIVDDASLRQLSETECVASTLPVPATYMGMHINQWGAYNTWPTGLQFGTLRMWDTGTRWKDVEPQRGVWNWKRLDYYVETAAKNRQSIIYTLGMTPQWASARPSDPQSGAVAEPANLADWRDYVRTVATRYKGKIKYWEMWNETNNSTFYNGTAQGLVALTRAARDELKAVDPENVVLSPNFTETGLSLMSQFLNAGGGEYFDTASVHWGGGLEPENRRPFFAAVQDLLQRAGVGAKPVWNTEGQSGRPASTDSAARGLLARTYLLEWAWGISNFTWYGWDLAVGSALSQADRVTPSPAGVAYQQIGGWLRGARMLAKSRSSDGTWTITMQRGDGTTAYAVWNVNGTKSFSIPAAWGASAARNLSGGSAAVQGGKVSIGIEPVLVAPLSGHAAVHRRARARLVRDRTRRVRDLSRHARGRPHRARH